jgi:hypothetical protein
MKMNEGLDEGPIIASQEICSDTLTPMDNLLIEQISHDSCSVLYSRT